MNRTLLRSAFSIVELLLGIALVALGSYSLWSMHDCPELVHDCVGWSLVGGAMFLPPGILVAAGGALSYLWRRLPVALVQSLMIGFLIAYYFVMGFE